jgi:nitronate monooxygenase
MAYVGTRFLATAESLAVDRKKEMVLEANAADIVYTPAVSGVSGNFLRASLAAAGRNPDDLTPPAQLDFGTTEAKAWRDLWAAGQGVGAIDEVLPARKLCERIASEYRSAIEGASAAHAMGAD